MGDRLVRASFPQQSSTEVALYFRKTGSKFERLLKLVDGFVQAATVSQAFPKPVVCHMISGGHGESVPPERLTVAPVGSLDMSAPGQRYNGDRSRRCQNSALALGSQGICNRPCHQQIETDLGQISVSIGMRL